MLIIRLLGKYRVLLAQYVKGYVKSGIGPWLEKCRRFNEIGCVFIFTKKS